MDTYFFKIFKKNTGNNEIVVEKILYCISDIEMFKMMQELLENDNEFSIYKAQCVLDLS